MLDFLIGRMDTDGDIFNVLTLIHYESGWGAGLLVDKDGITQDGRVHAWNADTGYKVIYIIRLLFFYPILEHM